MFIDVTRISLYYTPLLKLLFLVPALIQCFESNSFTSWTEGKVCSIIITIRIEHFNHVELTLSVLIWPLYGHFTRKRSSLERKINITNSRTGWELRNQCTDHEFSFDTGRLFCLSGCQNIYVTNKTASFINFLDNSDLIWTDMVMVA